MNPDLTLWAIRNRISAQALDELTLIFNPLISTPTIPAGVNPQSEAAVQALVRLEAAHKGLRLWRNNVGALLDSRGVPVRYGLANDTAQLNRTVKSGDLIGWRPLRITPEHVGSKIAQFVSRECKRPGWQYGGDDHQRAQLKWAELVNADGGDAKFCTGEGTL
jgi:hypothetical protein